MTETEERIDRLFQGYFAPRYLALQEVVLAPTEDHIVRPLGEDEYAVSVGPVWAKERVEVRFKFSPITDTGVEMRAAMEAIDTAIALNWPMPGLA